MNFFATLATIGLTLCAGTDLFAPQQHGGAGTAPGASSSAPRVCPPDCIVLENIHPNPRVHAPKSFVCLKCLRGEMCTNRNYPGVRHQKGFCRYPAKCNGTAILDPNPPCQQIGCQHFPAQGPLVPMVFRYSSTQAPADPGPSTQPSALCQFLMDGNPQRAGIAPSHAQPIQQFPDAPHELLLGPPPTSHLSPELPPMPPRQDPMAIVQNPDGTYHVPMLVRQATPSGSFPIKCAAWGCLGWKPGQPWRQATHLDVFSAICEKCLFGTPCDPSNFDCTIFHPFHECPFKESCTGEEVLIMPHGVVGCLHPLPDPEGRPTDPHKYFFRKPTAQNSQPPNASNSSSTRPFCFRPRSSDGGAPSGGPAMDDVAVPTDSASRPGTPSPAANRRTSLASMVSPESQNPNQGTSSYGAVYEACTRTPDSDDEDSGTQA